MLSMFDTEILQYPLCPPNLRQKLDPDVTWVPIIWTRLDNTLNATYLACQHNDGTVSVAVCRLLNSRWKPIARLIPETHGTLTVELGPNPWMVWLPFLGISLLWALAFMLVLAMVLNVLPDTLLQGHGFTATFILLGLPVMILVMMWKGSGMAEEDRQQLKEQLTQWFGPPHG